MAKLTAVTVKALRTPGKYLDGHGLFLHVLPDGRRYWIYRYTRDGRERVMSLGSAEAISLAEARSRHARERAVFLAAGDPLAVKQAAAEAAEREMRSFAQVAEQYIKAHEAGWKNPKLAGLWRNTLAQYAYPKLGKKLIHEIDVNDVLDVLEPIWTIKNETAFRVRLRIETVLSYAKARGWRSGENPAAWRDNLAMMLPKRSKVRAVQHHPALDWRDAPDFIRKLMARDTGIGARALLFAILTAARSGEVRGATWDEIDMENATWTIPPRRADGQTGMKAGRMHRVPLTQPALDVLRGLAGVRTDMRSEALVFPSTLKDGAAMSDMTLTACLRRMKRDGITVHGFRSTFRDWAADHGKPADLAEAALAHVNGDKTMAAYQRSDLFERRRALMVEWAAFLSAPAIKLAA
jgi:integrase